jgi:DDE superfamily endonuclease
MPPALPDSLARLLSLLRPAFTAPSFDTFCWLVHGFIGRVGEHTITGVWQAARLGGVLHHSRAHDFFARRRWSPDRLGLLVAQFVVERFVAAEAPIRMAVDDTLFRRSGRKVFAAGWYFDGDAKAGRSVQFGNVFVCLGLLVRLPALGERVVCLPVLFRLWRPPAAGGEHRTMIELAHELVNLIAARFEDRRLEVLGDGAYATKALAGLPENVVALVRLRTNAALYATPPERTGRPGRPRKKGHRLGSPAELLESGHARQRIQLERADKTPRRLEAVTLDCLWYHGLGQRTVRVVAARERECPDRVLLAVLCTDPQLPAAEILSRYLDRWAIEVAFQHAKGQLGVGQARNRVARAVQRTVPFGFLCQTLTLIWYALHGEPDKDVARRRRQAPWYRQKREPAFADTLIALRRELIQAEFQAQHLDRRSHAKTNRLRPAPTATAA